MRTQEPPLAPTGVGHESLGLSMALRIQRSPLDAWKNEAILENYNRLTSARIPMREFLHWLHNGPEGPAWHILLESEERGIVGHSCVIPLRTHFDSKSAVAGKSEYSFILEKYQSAQVRNFEGLKAPRNAFMIRQLFEHCKAQGIDPILVSTIPASRRSLYSVGMSTIEIPVWECLLVLRPLAAARNTPNLQEWQRGALGLVGAFQSGVWSLAGLFGAVREETGLLPASEGAFAPDSRSLGFFEDAESLRWRYGLKDYRQLALRSTGSERLILKIGSADRYLRVCQWHLGEEQPTLSTIRAMVHLAKEQNALGVRWAVYGNQRDGLALVHRLRSFGFLYAQRKRQLLIYSANQNFLSPNNWRLTDAMFSFDP